MKSYGFLFIGLLLLLCASCTKQREKNVVVSRDYAIFQQCLTEIVPLVIHMTQSKRYLNDVIQRGEDSLHSQAKILLLEGDTSDISLGTIVLDVDYTDTEEIVMKSGKISVSVFQYTRSTGGNIRLVFDGFKVKQVTFSGQLQIARLSTGNFSIAQANFYLSDAGKRISYDAFITYSIDRGADLDVLSDDRITISDSGEFTNRNKVRYSVTNIGIIRQMSCQYIEKGLVELINTNNVTQVLDFGSGCNNEATVTYDESVLNVIF
jgi:hypothetical protein